MSGRRWMLVVGTVLGLAACAPTVPLEAQTARTHPLGPEDGYFEESLSPFDDEHPAIARLDPELRAAAQAAATDAGALGVDMVVTSGWRSPRYQETLLAQAIEKYGSEAEALRWVSTPEESRHVTGDAVDFGPTDANSWLSRHGYRYGLCQTYANEMWHYELTVEPGQLCPAPLPDATSR